MPFARAKPSAPRFAPGDPAEFQAVFLARLKSTNEIGQLFDLLPEVYFFAKDREGRFVRMNAALVRALGFNNEREVLARDDYAFFSRELADRYRDEDERVMRSDRPVLNAVWVVPNRQGVLSWYVSSKIPLHDESGRVIGVAGAMRELSSAGPSLGPFEPLAPAISYLHEHFGESITLASLAARAKLSVSQFQRHFRQFFRTSPMQYLIQIRLQRACHQLERTSRTISEIALACGFYDQSAFVRHFRARLGQTPSDYRKGHRAPQTREDEEHTPPLPVSTKERATTHAALSKSPAPPKRRGRRSG